ncbi:PREDICTED: cysteine-rich protein 2-binding protein-like isoform X2 [Cyprinodon variegatus]|uniref:Cysteine-rich protein 2-binding protein n=1 Tax=Cyprinodon variegatus TaxID=28743 RepID=A0A3Q2CLP5_CYPVA|nr:PREDICTED: cysteine-rich protein 2-binding protein isoform X2 [Cyprinodon variegatus]XP_015259974.1 PREDICTED: cysteine-rich protein 2-binding protein-like isoform X2 [Cyprinodon variegatus]
MDSSGEQLAAAEDEAAGTSASEGLEEGEVEGETLLIVESEDQGSVDLSHDQSGDSLTSDVGEETDGGWACEDMSFYCDRCHKWIPAAQLRGEQPSYLKGDNFFKFLCSSCSEDGKESFERMRLTWQQVVMLAMYNLSLEGTGRQGYFRWKEDICSFIGRHWNFLLGNRKKTSTWWSTVAGCLSVGSPTFFRSGAQEFGEPGWWKLVQNRPPTLRPDGDKTSTKIRASRPPMDPIITVEGLRKRGARNPVESAMQLKEKRSRTQEAKDIRRAQKEAAGGYTDRSASSTPVKMGVCRGGRRPDLVLERGEVIDFSSLSSSDRTPLTSPSPSPSPDFSGPGTPASHSATPSLLSEADLIPDAMPPQALFHDDEEMETEGMIDPGMEYVPPPNINVSRKKLRPPQTFIKREADSEEDEGHDQEGRCEESADCEAPPSSSRGGGGGGVVERRRTTVPEKSDAVAAPEGPRFSPLSLYEERLLLRRMDACQLALAVTPQAKRLYRKLLIRHAKRQRGLPLFDIDRAVSATLSLVGGVYGTQEVDSRVGVGVKGTFCTSSQEERILDRFQTNASSRRGVQQRSVSFWHRLMGAEGSLEQNIKSPYTARILKPFIRRDFESKPLKLRLLAEIRAYPHRKDPDWIPEPDAPIDYCYVRPNHIPSVNAMCHDSFWPGVDLSECLQYPDFSVVVLYKKVVVGFGFMVPDVKYNEAYISFLLVHPEWRKAGIGTFMIYHLIQTCMGKDVTLHVSASNPAMLLYQKFGFKAEEYILDFYDKYYPVDSGECRHAFFLRLRR